MPKRRPQPTKTKQTAGRPVDPNLDLQVSLALAQVQRTASVDDISLEAMLPAVGPLRMLLIDENLKICAASHRIGLRLRPAPSAFLDQSEPLSSVAFAAGGECFAWGGRRIGGFMRESGPVTHSGPAHDPADLWRFDTFMNQTAIIVDGVKIQRRKVLSYIAHKTWLHYNADRSDPLDAYLDRARSGLFVGIGGGEGDVAFELNGTVTSFSKAPVPFVRKLDMVHLQVLITCQLLMASPSVLELKAIVDKAGH